jgi:hypothetical protein
MQGRNGTRRRHVVRVCMSAAVSREFRPEMQCMSTVHCLQAALQLLASERTLASYSYCDLAAAVQIHAHW